MISHIPNMVNPVCRFFWHFQLTLYVQLMSHLGQPLVSEARKSYTHLLLICWQVCRLAHSAVAPYQKQLCLGLIFLAPISDYLSCSGHGSHHSLIHSFLWHVQNATIPCRSRIIFHSSLLCTFSCHPSTPTILPSSLTSSCHLFLGLPLNLVVPKIHI